MPYIPTNPRNTTIDLAFTNMPLVSANVEGHLATGSDHFTISINIPEVSLQPKPASRPLLRSPENIKRFLQLIKEGPKDIPAINLPPAPADIDLPCYIPIRNYLICPTYSRQAGKAH